MIAFAIRLAPSAWLSAGLCVGLHSPSHAQAPLTPDAARNTQAHVLLGADDEFAFALQLAIGANDWQGALDVLDRRPDLAARPDAIRLRAELYRKVGRDRDALALLEEHLTRNPDDALARFQLAEIHFADMRDQDAALNYRLSLAGRLDATRTQIANERLAEIANRRVWRFWAGASASPDSNLNSATDAARVDLFGLPFELDDDARRQSGISLSVFGGVERRFPVAEDMAIRASLIGSLIETPGATFDQIAIAARTGPEWRFGRDSFVSLQATSSKRWFGGDAFETRGGLQLDGEFSSDLTRWSGAIQLDSIDDLRSPARDGWAATVDINRTVFTSPSSLWRIGAAASHREAAAKSESYDQLMLKGGYLTPGPFSLMAYIEPYALVRDHEGAAFAFGIERQDVEYGVSLRVSKRDWIVAGAFPFISLSVARNESNISLFDFARERMEFGFTREF